MAVCIISNVADTHAICVEHALKLKGEEVVNWHWPDFPSVDRLSVSFDSAGKLSLPVLDAAPGACALWVHRGLAPVPSPSLHPADVGFVMNESSDLLSGILMQLAADAFCVNPLGPARQMRSKLRQMVVATECGLRVPPSLFSNDPADIREFFRAHEGQVVMKHSNQMYWESEGDGQVYMPFTQRITEEHLGNDAQLASCPAIFQREIKKSCELRIVFFGKNIFAVKIDSQREKESVDWRKDFRGLPPCSVFELPPAERAKVLAFIRASGLHYGSIDVIVDTAGAYVFLEVNETGQFLWLEDVLPELPLLDCFAEFLIRRDPEYAYRPGRRVVACAEVDRHIAPAEIAKRRPGHVEPKNYARMEE